MSHRTRLEPSDLCLIFFFFSSLPNIPVREESCGLINLNVSQICPRAVLVLFAHFYQQRGQSSSKLGGMRFLRRGSRGQGGALPLVSWVLPHSHCLHLWPPGLYWENQPTPCRSCSVYSQILFFRPASVISLAFCFCFLSW